ncbi:MFS transporter [Saccharopolyspora sp. K220]|uniref:MFS transporter n=1 Tax=Saccharopolyspora soli TaxID=2926618 RepID=UPI001F5913FB|nr:MFS transporter [Saccharopolyspora soli]MCI2420566.1 MFS transporter [Saccharopolyspora soli]
MIRQESNDLPSWRLAVLAVGTFVLGVDGFVLPGLLPPIAADLSVSVAAAGQLTTAFAVTYAVGSPIIATATGRMDRRVVIGVGMGTFLVGMVLQAAGPSYVVVLVGRIIAALGAAAFQANAFAVAGVLSRPERRARSFAMVGAGSSLASVLGVPLGLLIGQWVGWRGAMWTIVALAAVAAVLAAVGVPSVTLPATSLRSRVSVLVNPRILVLLVVSALVLAPSYLVSSYAAAVVGVSTSASSAVLVALFVFGAGFFTGNRLVGRFADRFGSLATLIAALAVTICTTAALSAVAHWFVPTLVALFALGLVGSFLFITQQNRVFVAGGDVAAVALGLNGSMNYVGTAIGAAVGGVVLSLAGVRWLAPAAAVVAAIVVGITWLTAPERRMVASPVAATTAGGQR